ncbi:hypothetical protein BAY61_14830 [Prauserella marina]|uniref:Peptide/nickel transport system ATP-binding protein n=1 Tax=Prauserella marina TaxID=530584 RepID=A0A222VQ55_9PSEU|nr:ABC transporter ATP-binding protein [Prauserella marina]ASR36066.1 hypothetical protein BAY61_14830 [Prauserella marina]PWV76793.1 peptide/nickel transport system ATP-binding protein [Prauserella marina]SDC97745.1 peptide/nickel transport system ATP-binding protein [Prauserella marina]
MLDIEGLAVSIGGTEVLAVDQLSLGEGERLGVVGESGSGKTMLAMGVAGLLPRQARVTGSIRFEGTDLAGLRGRQRAAARRGRVGVVFQDPQQALNPMMRVGRQIGEALRLGAGRAAAARSRVAESLAEVRLPAPAELMRRYPHQLSGGQRQRVLLAMAMACRPALLIADEPTTALDATVRVEILELIDELSAAHRMAVLFVSHDLGVVRKVSDRIAVLYGGTLMEQGPSADIVERPLHRYTEALIAANPGAPDPDEPRGRRFGTIEGSVPPAGEFPSGCRFRDRCPHETDRCSVPPPRAEARRGHVFRCWNPVTREGSRGDC